MARPTKWSDKDTEERRYKVVANSSRHGRSTCTIECPFCTEQSVAYVWSLCGGGKRCENKQCGALFGSTGTAHKVRA